MSSTVASSVDSRSFRKSFQPIRNRFLKEHPTCARCGAAAQEVHHIKALVFGGTNDEENLSPLCKSCHKEFDVFEAVYMAARGSDEIEDMYPRFLCSPSMRAIVSICLSENETGLMGEMKELLCIVHQAEVLMNGGAT